MIRAIQLLQLLLTVDLLLAGIAMPKMAQVGMYTQNDTPLLVLCMAWNLEWIRIFLVIKAVQQSEVLVMVVILLLGVIPMVKMAHILVVSDNDTLLPTLAWIRVSSKYLYTLGSNMARDCNSSWWRICHYLVEWSTRWLEARNLRTTIQLFNIGYGFEFREYLYTRSDQTWPTIAALPDGGYLVVWESNNQDGSGFGIYGRRYNASGDSWWARIPALIRIEKVINNGQLLQLFLTTGM